MSMVAGVAEKLSIIKYNNICIGQLEDRSNCCHRTMVK